METFKQRLTRWHKGVISGSQGAFAMRVGVKGATVSRWVSGDSPPNEDTRPIVCKELGITEQQLMAMFPAPLRRVGKPLPQSQHGNIATNDGEIQYPFKGIPMHYIRVVGYLSANECACVFNNSPTLEVLPVISNGQEMEGLKVTGSGLEPTLSDGEYVALAAYKGSFEDGGLVTAIIKESGECVFRRAYHQGELVLLIPDNNKGKRIVMTAQDVITGVVVYAVKKVATKKRGV